MDYKEYKKLIKKHIVPSLVQNLSITDNILCMDQSHSLKFLKSLKETLPKDYYFLYEELRDEYQRQLRENILIKGIFTFPFSVTSYARKHGLVKELKQSLNQSRLEK